MVTQRVGGGGVGPARRRAGAHALACIQLTRTHARKRRGGSAHASAPPPEPPAVLLWRYDGGLLAVAPQDAAGLDPRLQLLVPRVLPGGMGGWVDQGWLGGLVGRGGWWGPCLVTGRGGASGACRPSLMGRAPAQGRHDRKSRRGAPPNPLCLPDEVDDCDHQGVALLVHAHQQAVVHNLGGAGCATACRRVWARVLVWCVCLRGACARASGMFVWTASPTATRPPPAQACTHAPRQGSPRALRGRPCPSRAPPPWRAAAPGPPGSGPGGGKGQEGGWERAWDLGRI